jgi:hypothetical protein
MRTPVLIVTGRPTASTLTFADDLARIIPHQVVVVSDSGFDARPAIADGIHISDEEAVQARCFNSSPLIKRTPIAWDKALYLLMTRRVEFDHAWIIEDDVAFASPDLARDLIAKYAGTDADLLAAKFFRPSEQPEWGHWRHAAPFEPAHQAGGFMPLARLSRSLIDRCAEFVEQHRSFCFIETMFPSLVVKHGLRAETFDFVHDERRFRFEPAFERWELLQKIGDTLGEGVFHPVKSDSLRTLATSRRLTLRQPSTWDIALFKLFGPSFEPMWVRRRFKDLDRLKQKLRRSA